MCHKKKKTDINIRAKPGTDPPEKCWAKDFILPHKHHAPNFNRRFWHTLAN